jgi:hypothetical protein
MHLKNEQELRLQIAKELIATGLNPFEVPRHINSISETILNGRSEPHKVAAPTAERFLERIEKAISAFGTR